MSETAPHPDKNTLVRAFNAHFFDFINDIISVVEQNEEIIVSKKTFEMIKRANPTAIIKIWYQRIYAPYVEIIDRGDVKFICEKNYEEDLVGIPNANEIMSIINKIRAPIKNMSNVNKAHAIKFIQNLSKLSLHYANVTK